MIIIRPITKEDTEALIKIAFTAGIGMTSMPKNREILEKKVSDSVAAFAKEVSMPGEETYLFVLEDLDTGAVGGICGVIARTGSKQPLSFYRIEKKEQHEGPGSSIKIVPSLHVVHHKNYWSEIGSLYLTEDFRHSGLGRLLSLSRFLFIAAFPERFHKMIFAEMRGHVNDEAVSPFWEGIGRHFVDTTFENLMHLRDVGIMDLSKALPKHPIYIELLPEKVQESLGKIHDEAKAAMKMLVQEGFKISNELDICDGGPKIEIETMKIRSVESSRLCKVAEMTEEILDNPLYIVSNDLLNFRACLSKLKVLPDESVVIPQGTAEALKLHLGASIRYVSPYNKVKK